jgi:hypothetical protein
VIACQICFAGSDAVVRASMNAGIGVLLVVTAVVLACFARFFLILARRSRESAHLVEERGLGSGPRRPASMDERSLVEPALIERALRERVAR